jgi:L-ascorbate metabolism protein UlaG (beta-lactamase superfamily)
MRLTWLGHSSVLVELAGVRVLADPVLRRRAGPLRRRGRPPELPGQVDAVVVSHLHHDHCDLPSLRRLAAPVVVAPAGAGAWLRRQGIAGVVELPVGAVLPLDGVTVTAVPAHHDGRREPFGPRAGAVGHLVEAGASTVWLAGDTGPFPGMARLAGTRRIDLAAIPVWGWGPNLGPGHLDPRTAAEAAVRARVAHAVPVHWGTLHPLGLGRPMRELLRTPGPEFARHLAGTAVTAHVLPVGGHLELSGSGRTGDPPGR